jgi:hypothetical protein
LAEVGISGALFFGSFAFGELAEARMYLQFHLFLLLGSFGRTKEMNRQDVVTKNRADDLLIKN